MKRRFIIASTIAIAITSACDGSTGPRTGSLTVTINGLPAEIPAVVTVITPKNTALAVTATSTLNDLEPGTYQVTAYNAANNRSTFAPTNVTATVEVLASKTPTQASVTYTVTTGVVSVSITGVPAGATAAVSLVGPGAPRIVNGAGEVGNLAPGVYSVIVNNVDADELYGGTASQSSLTIEPSTTAVPLSITYAATTGRVTLTPTGLPTATATTWDLTGPAGFTKTVTSNGPIVVTHLPPGQYAATTRNILVGADTYGSVSNPTSFTITAGQGTQVNIPYVIRPPTLDLTVAAAYIVQSTQNISGSVPLVAGREAYLRVFVKANEANTAAPAVRARFYRNGQLIATHDVAPPRSSVPLAISEVNATDSWNATIPKAELQPGTSMLIDIDPANAIHEVDEADNQYPLNGSPMLLDIRSVPVSNLRFVPIMTGDGAIGNTAEPLVSNMVNMTLRIHPLSAINADVRAPFSTSLTLAKNDSNNAWPKILSQIEALRVTEGTGRQYVGVLKDNVGTGVAGIGYVPGRSVVVFDQDQAVETIAHELGHNWGRLHAPCGGPAYVDPDFPYPNARIGVYGFDNATARILPPDMPDLMSYCWLSIGFNISTPRRWTSDYTYMSVMDHRQAFGDAVAGDAARQECLIVWGRVTGSGLVLEPAFVANTIPVLPSRNGKLRLAAIDESGATLTSISFDPLEVEDGLRAEEHFAFAIPLTRLPINRLAALTLSGEGRAAQKRTAQLVDSAPAQVTVSNPQSGLVRFKWDSSKTPLLVISDARSGEILSLATSGDAVVRSTASAFNVKASNGVRSMEMQLRR
jgi:hypothetical protein